MIPGRGVLRISHTGQRGGSNETAPCSSRDLESCVLGRFLERNRATRGVDNIVDPEAVLVQQVTIGTRLGEAVPQANTHDGDAGSFAEGFADGAPKASDDAVFFHGDQSASHIGALAN